MSETFTGKVWVLGDDIDTDIIIPTEYLALKTVQDMTPYAFSPLRPELASQIKPGDIIVAGKNFGCGSSREQAPEIHQGTWHPLRDRGPLPGSSSAIPSTIGLLLIENPDLRDVVTEGEKIEVTVGEKVVCDGKEYPIASLPQNLMDIINAGGLVKAMRQLNGLED